MLSLAERLRAATRWTWPQLLLAAYTFTFFLPSITRYKSLILLLLLATAAARIVRREARIRELGQSAPIRALLFLSAAVLYGCAISPDFALSLRDANAPVIVDSLIVGLLWPIVLQDTSGERIAAALIAGFAAGLAVLLGLDLRQYYVDFVQRGIAFGTEFNHRELSYGLLVTMPFALCGLRHKRTWVRALSLLLLGVAGLSLLGTLARGAWLAGAIVLALWIWHYRAWRLALVIGLAAAVVAGSWAVRYPGSLLSTKLHQTDSSLRWGGGVQSATMDLIFENPWRGYGFGDEIYAGVYNSRVAAYPGWLVRKSMGPHNMTLRMWFGCGILGLASILAVYLTIVSTSLRVLRATSGVIHDAAFAVLLAFVGAVFVRGLFESAYMNYFGWMIGTLTAFARPGNVSPLPDERASAPEPWTAG
jgi:O-antigen ligase